MYCLETLAIVVENDDTTEWVQAHNQHFEDSRDIAAAIVENYEDMNGLCDEGYIKAFSLTHFTVIHQ